MTERVDVLGWLVVNEPALDLLVCLVVDSKSATYKTDRPSLR
jgi:hypothetical protein